MIMRADQVEIRIVPRVSAQGHPFTEVFYKFDEHGELRHALTRRNYRIDDTPHARAHERQEFIKRRREA